MSTNIEWTDVTDNIFRVLGGGWWCEKCSPGCKNCYAALLNLNSFFGGNGLAYSGTPPVLVLQKDICDSWASQTKAKRHFVASMTDIFGAWVGLEDTFYFLDAMRAAPKQSFQMLTKRAAVMLERCQAWLVARGLSQLPDNMWCGVSVENQEFADKRIPLLLQIPARVRFLSVEPLLSELRLCALLPIYEHVGKPCCVDKPGFHRTQKDTDIHWVIVGGESGPDARPCNVEWIRSVVEQCRVAKVPVFVKQLGARPVIEGEIAEITAQFPKAGGGFVDGAFEVILKHPKGGEMAEWPVDLRVRELPGFSLPADGGLSTI